jgi:peptidoglycan/LPS O-acetylase OafA/YrhL
MSNFVSTLASSAPSKLTARRADIPALTGLRFLAAFSVAVAHGASISLRMDDAPALFDAVRFWLENCAGFGMTLFFVLSGFVIHYNYSNVISLQGLHGFAQFLWARFCRLYPLFAVIVVADLLLGGRFYNSMVEDPRAGAASTLAALPYFLTFTQSWVYTIIGRHSLIYEIGNTIPVTWSISTEWFFYLCYPIVMLGVVRAGKPLYALGAAIAWSLVWGSFAYRLTGYGGQLDAWATSYFGQIANAQGGNQDSFVRWLLYFSPYLRIGEFVLGCITAQLYMVLDGNDVTRRERLLSSAALAIAAFSVPAILFLMYQPGGTSWIRALNNNFGLAPSIALLLFCAARYRPMALRVFSSDLAVKLGEASYSIYLTHLLIFSVIMSAAQVALPRGIESAVFLFVRLAVMLAAVLLISTGLYRNLEDPARRTLRRMWSSPGLLIRPSTVVVTPFIVAVAIFGFWRLVSDSNDQMIASSTGIVVRLASYGANCGAPEGNVTRNVREACGGKADCSYVVDVAKLGDTAPGCGKAFSAEFICAPDRTIHSLAIPGEAGFKSVARLQCHPRG